MFVLPEEEKSVNNIFSKLLCNFYRFVSVARAEAAATVIEASATVVGASATVIGASATVIGASATVIGAATVVEAAKRGAAPQHRQHRLS